MGNITIQRPAIGAFIIEEKKGSACLESAADAVVGSQNERSAVLCGIVE
jgi:hypothetical protein